MSSTALVYASASTNRYPQAADVAGSGLVAFGSGKFVALWNTSDSLDRGVFGTLSGHDGLVTCVRFISDEHIVSADDKGALIFWRMNADGMWIPNAHAQAHKGGISTLSVSHKYIVTGSSDGTLRIWITADKTGDWTEIQTIQMKKGFPISSALETLPGTTSPILVVGSTDRNIHMYICTENNFTPAAILQGHEDWVKCLAFKVPQAEGDPLVLASGAQDATIRLWNIEAFTRSTLTSQDQPTATADALLDAFEASLVNLEDSEDGGRQISLKRHIITLKSPSGSSQLFSVTFDALLVGHDAGVTSLSWRQQKFSTDLPTLLSTSTDSSLILWSPSTVITSSTDGTTLWINRQRFGDVGGQRLGGFVGGLWARQGEDAMAWGWNGGWRRWRRRSLSDSSSSTGPTLDDWIEVGAITGHRAPIRSVAWSPKGEYLMSASLDQTTRVYGPVAVVDAENTEQKVWHEIARPQVHGYDLVGAAFLGALRFVSIADEKVARVFEASREFVEVVNNLGVANIESDGASRPRAAAVPPLGLSNKALADTSAVTDLETMNDVGRTQRRPFESDLAAATLWPETEKVFGHGYESISLAVSNDKQFIATACKATSPEHAVVRVYDTQTWQSIGQPLAGHSLTITRIAFSPDDRLLLSVSRDRTWRLFESGEDGYVPVAADKSHGRIIWDCAWASEGDVFATASRDKTVKIWQRLEGAQKWVAVATIQANAAATAVAFAPDRGGQESRLLAIGLESGEILLYTASRSEANDWNKHSTIGRGLAHIDHIHHLAWRPMVGRKDGDAHQLASCSEDGTLKLLTVHIAAE